MITCSRMVQHRLDVLLCAFLRISARLCRVLFAHRSISNIAQQFRLTVNEQDRRSVLNPRSFPLPYPYIYTTYGSAQKPDWIGRTTLFGRPRCVAATTRFRSPPPHITDKTQPVPYCLYASCRCSPTAPPLARRRSYSPSWVYVYSGVLLNAILGKTG